MSHNEHEEDKNIPAQSKSNEVSMKMNLQDEKEDSPSKSTVKESNA